MSEAPRHEVIPEHLAGHRLDQALAAMFPEYSRNRLKAWLLEGFITVGERRMRPRDPVAGGETVTLVAQQEAEVTSRPEAMPLEIVHEDAAILVINKPPGLVVHPGAGNTHGTLMNGILHHVPDAAELPRAGIVHRLDKDTSGLLLIARNLRSHTELTRALAERRISRHYIAICSGALTGGGTIDAPIGRHPVDRKRMTVTEKGRPAITHYRVLERFPGHTYISVQLDTGRTHQIRVHFAHRRHALVGDRTYGGRLTLPRNAGEKLIAALRAFRRQALHASELHLAHPESGEQLTFAAEAPADFTALLDALRADQGAAG